jgi:hypothetical protein
MSFRRNLTWKLNWYRQSELDGALLLGRIVRQASDPYLIYQLTKHCADEARHAWLWEMALSTLNLNAVRINRSYQSFYFEETGPPQSLPEVLCLTHIFEHRVHRQFTEELTDPRLPDPARRTLRVLLKDEEGHLDWIASWLAAHAGAERILARYRQADERVYHRLLPYRERIWDIGGLGEELPTSRSGDEDDQKELDAAEPEHSTQADSGGCTPPGAGVLPPPTQ